MILSRLGRGLWRWIWQVRCNLGEDFLAVVLDNQGFLLRESSILHY